MKGRGLFWYSLIYLGGLIFSTFSKFTSIYSILPLLLSAIAPIGLYFLFPMWRRRILFAFLIFLFGYLYYGWVDSRNISQLPVGKVSFQGIIKNPPVFDGDLVRFTLGVTSVNNKTVPQENVVVSLYLNQIEDLQKAKDSLKYNQKCSGTMELQPLEEPTNPGSFDYKAYLYWKKIHRLGIVDNLSALSMNKSRAWSIQGLLYDFRGKLEERALQLYDKETAGLITGFVLGSTDELDPEVSLLFSHLGLTHILAISGQHITLLVMGLLALFRFFRVTREKAYIYTMFILPLYVCMTGGSPSAVRSLIMGELVLLALRFRLYRNSWNILAFAFLLMALVDPYYIHDIGFQLSFLVTFGLLVFVPPLMKMIPIRKTELNALFAVTLSATLISFPLTIYYFHLFSLFSPITNIICVPLFEFVVAPLATASLFLGIITPEAGWIFSSMANYTLKFIVYGLNCLDNLEFSRLIFSSPPILWIFGYIFGLILFFFLIYSKVDSRRYSWAILSGFVVFTTLMLSLQQANAPTVRITILDVGQGDCIVVETPGNVTVIDCAGPAIMGSEEEWQKRRNPFNPSKNVLIPYLYFRGIHKIDALILTHWDYDHVGGVSYLIQHFPVGRVVMNGEPESSASNREIQRIMNEKKIPQEIAGKNEAWNNGIIHWQVLNPTQGNKTSNTNDQSLVLLLEVNGHRFLFTGDLEESGEKTLLQGEPFWPVDVLKVGHHGSNSSTSAQWVQALQPRLSVISVGKRNRYGHPNLEVIQLLQKNGGKVERTDQSGAITIILDRNQVNYQTYRNNKKIPFVK